LIKVNFIHSQQDTSAIPTTFGQCKLPLTPASDRDVDRNSGLRFGTQRETYLEFDRRLKIVKRSEFGIEFKTTEKEGIIFYIADDRNSDFIALFMKDGKVGKLMK